MLFAALLMACLRDPNAPPPEPEGEFKVLAVQTSQAVIEGVDVITGAYPGCTWGQRTFTFDGETLGTEIDVLCPSVEHEAFGCQVEVRAQATWDAARGVFQVPHTTVARGYFQSHNDGERPERLSQCRAELTKGDYTIARVYNGRWKWEVRTPDGAVHRLVSAESRPDFVGAMLATREEEE